MGGGFLGADGAESPVSDPFLLAAETVLANFHTGVGIPEAGRVGFPQPILLNAQH